MRTKAFVSLAILLGSTAAIAGVQASTSQDGLTTNNTVIENTLEPAPAPEPAPTPEPAPEPAPAPTPPAEPTPPN